MHIKKNLNNSIFIDKEIENYKQSASHVVQLDGVADKVSSIHSIDQIDNICRQYIQLNIAICNKRIAQEANRELSIPNILRNRNERENMIVDQHRFDFIFFFLFLVQLLFIFLFPYRCMQFAEKNIFLLSLSFCYHFSEDQQKNAIKNKTTTASASLVFRKKRNFICTRKTEN